MFHNNILSKSAVDAKVHQNLCKPHSVQRNLKINQSKRLFYHIIFSFEKMTAERNMDTFFIYLKYHGTAEN